MRNQTASVANLLVLALMVTLAACKSSDLVSDSVDVETLTFAARHAEHQSAPLGQSGLDDSFGTLGVSADPLAGDSWSWFFPPAMAIRENADPPSGAIYYLAPLTSGRNLLRKVSLDGIPDRSFGINGEIAITPKVRPDGGEAPIWGPAILALPDESIFFAFVSSGVLEIGRVSPAGTIDASFSHLLADAGHLGELFAAAMPNGDILLVTLSPLQSAPELFRVLIVKVDRNGALVTTFGDQGIVTLTAPWSAEPSELGRVMFLEGLRVQADGKIVIAGNTVLQGPPCRRAFVWRLNADGSFDTDFADRGNLYIQPPDGTGSFLKSLVPGPSGALIVGGQHMAKILPDGSIDPTFGTNGSGYLEIASDVILPQSDGTFLVQDEDEETWVAVSAAGTVLANPPDLVSYLNHPAVAYSSTPGWFKWMQTSDGKTISLQLERNGPGTTLRRYATRVTPATVGAFSEIAKSRTAH